MQLQGHLTKWGRGGGLKQVTPLTSCYSVYLVNNPRPGYESDTDISVPKQPRLPSLEIQLNARLGSGTKAFSPGPRQTPPSCCQTEGKTHSYCLNSSLAGHTWYQPHHTCHFTLRQTAKRGRGASCTQRMWLGPADSSLWILVTGFWFASGFKGPTTLISVFHSAVIGRQHIARM